MMTNTKSSPVKAMMDKGTRKSMQPASQNKLFGNPKGMNPNMNRAWDKK